MREPPYDESSLRAGGAYGTLLTGRRSRCLRDEPPYGPEAGAYGTEALGRASLRAGGGGNGGTDGTNYKRASGMPPYGTEALGRASLRAGGGGAYGTSLLASLRAGGAYGTSLLTGRASSCASLLTNESSLRAGGAYTEHGTPPYGAEALTGRALLRAGDAYGTSLYTGRRQRLTGRASLRDGGVGTSLLALTGRSDYGRRLRDEPPYGREALTGRASY